MINRLDMIKRILIIAAVAAACLLGAVVACKNYETAPENAHFTIRASANDGTVNDGCKLEIVMTFGEPDGENTISLSVYNVDNGVGVSTWRLLANGRTTITEGSPWSFDEDGRAWFVLEGLPRGQYRAQVTVKRWYHTASDVVEFTINQ